MRWWWPLFLGLLGRLTVAQEMMISEELETCSTLDRTLLEGAFSDAPAPEGFLGRVTVLFNVAPPKPVQTPRVFADRDPIYYNKIDYREQIYLYHNLYRMFRSKEPYRNTVRFLLSASLHRVPYEVVQYNFPDFLSTVREVAAEHNLTVYANPLTENRTFALFGLGEFQAYVIDRCSRVSYIIQPPWSLLQHAYVKAAVLSTFYDRPCGKCEFENFLNSTVLDEEKQHPPKGGISLEESSDEWAPTGEDESDASGATASDEHEDSESDSGGEHSKDDGADPFANLSVTGPELALPLRVILPVLHIHVGEQPDGNETDGNNTNPTTHHHQLHHYVVLHTNDTDRHYHQQHDQVLPGGDVQLEELSLPLNTTRASSAEAESDSEANQLRIEGTDWPTDQLREILNVSSVLYDPVQQRVFERLRRYNLTQRSQYDEVAEISVANRYAAWNRRRQPPKVEQARHNRRRQIKKHYARLIPWLNWTFGKAIPPAGARTSRRLKRILRT